MEVSLAGKSGHTDKIPRIHLLKMDSDTKNSQNCEGKQSSVESLSSHDEMSLQVSVVLFRVSLEFGQSGVYPELCTRLHRVLFVVVPTSQKSRAG